MQGNADEKIWNRNLAMKMKEEEDSIIQSKPMNKEEKNEEKFWWIKKRT
jgi:hypothetical protein